MGNLRHAVLVTLSSKEAAVTLHLLKYGPFLLQISPKKKKGRFWKYFLLPVILKFSWMKINNSYIVTRSGKYLNNTGLALTKSYLLLVVFKVQGSKAVSIHQLSITSHTFWCSHVNLGSPDMFLLDFWNSVSLILTEIILHDYEENNLRCRTRKLGIGFYDNMSL